MCSLSVLEPSVKRSHKRILIILLVLALAVIALSACGGVTTDPETGQTVYKPGIFEPLAAPLRATVVFFHDHLLAPLNVKYAWGWAIILVAVVIRGLLLPLSFKQMKSMKEAQIKMQVLQPELDRLKKKYGKDKQRYQQEQMKLYQQHGITQAQMAGCLPTLIQMPILFAFYYAILGLALGGQIVGEPWYFIPDISRPAYREGMSWLTKGLSFTDLGGSIQHLLSPEVWPYLVLPILLAITQFVMVRGQSANQPKPSSDDSNPAAGMMGQMTWLMTGMFVFFALQVPAGLSLYWVVGNALAMMQQLYVNRKREGWEKAAHAEMKNNGSKALAEEAKAEEPAPRKGSTAMTTQSKTVTAKPKSSARRKRRKRR